MGFRVNPNYSLLIGPKYLNAPRPTFSSPSENFAASGKGRDFAKNLRRVWTTARRRWRTRLKHKQVAFAKFCCVFMQLLCKCGFYLLNVEYRLQSTGWVHIKAASITLRDGFKKSKWKFKMAFAIRGPTPLPPLMAQIFLPHFFSFAIESYIYETDFTLQKYHF